MKIAILSDSHDAYENLEKAVNSANNRGCTELLFAGDLIAPGEGIDILSHFNGNVHIIFGNNDGEVFGLTKQAAKHPQISLEGQWYETEFDGIKLFMNHYPRLAQIAAHSGLFDVVIYGHDHTAHEERVGDTLLLNPGTLHPRGVEKTTFAIFDTETKKTELIEVS